jgi:hypothetical protein
VDDCGVDEEDGGVLEVKDAGAAKNGSASLGLLLLVEKSVDVGRWLWSVGVLNL